MKEIKYPVKMKWVGIDGSKELLVVEFTDLKTGKVDIDTTKEHVLGEVCDEWIEHTDTSCWEPYEEELPEDTISFPIKMQRYSNENLFIVEFTELNKGTVIYSDVDMLPVGFSAIWDDFTNTSIWTPYIESDDVFVLTIPELIREALSNFDSVTYLDNKYTKDMLNVANMDDIQAGNLMNKYPFLQEYITRTKSKKQFQDEIQDKIIILRIKLAERNSLVEVNFNGGRFYLFNYKDKIYNVDLNCMKEVDVEEFLIENYSDNLSFCTLDFNESLEKVFKYYTYNDSTKYSSGGQITSWLSKKELKDIISEDSQYSKANKLQKSFRLR